MLYLMMSKTMKFFACKVMKIRRSPIFGTPGIMMYNKNIHFKHEEVKGKEGERKKVTTMMIKMMYISNITIMRRTIMMMIKMMYISNITIMIRTIMMMIKMTCT